ncbi:MAG: hypothetical protein JWM31_3401, partial [Solirubrobacterales bacterium]|nr:hypothetical protein [Solirubrobacterales bacterium]
KTDFTDASDQEIADAMKAAEPVSFPLPGEGNRRVYLRFECKTCGESANTTVHLDPRIYTKYPREGEGQWVNERLAIENSRTSIESVHAELLWLGDAQKGTHKIVKDTDWKVAWLDGLAVHALTLRYLVHLDGTYERARIDLRRYGFNIGNRSDGEQVGLDHVPLNASERKRVRAEMESLAAPPASWVKAKGEDAVALTGYSRESRIRDLVAAPG